MKEKSRAPGHCIDDNIRHKTGFAQVLQRGKGVFADLERPGPFLVKAAFACFRLLRGAHHLEQDALYPRQGKAQTAVA